MSSASCAKNYFKRAFINHPSKNKTILIVLFPKIRSCYSFASQSPKRDVLSNKALLSRHPKQVVRGPLYRRASSVVL